MNEAKTNPINEKVQSFGLFLNKHAKEIAVFMVIAVLMSMVTFATADTMWTTLVTFLQKWIRRIGALAFIFGGVQLGLGFGNNDPSQKMLGAQMLAGAAISIGIIEVAAAFLT